MSAAAKARNAAIWVSSDGFNPKAKGINGRRVAGESFLRGYFRHAEVEEFLGVAHGSEDLSLFRGMGEAAGAKAPIRTERLDEIAKMTPVGTLYYGSPTIANECWRRAPLGAAHHAICGITHTTSTKAVMEQMLALRVAPQREWDAIICTSRAVQASVRSQMELIDAYLKDRFGAAPPGPMLPRIPLGISQEDYARDPVAGAGLRAKLGLAEGAVLFLVIARLTANEKFDPLPFYLALAEAQRQLGPGVPLHLALCGIFAEDKGRAVFEKGALALMPEVKLHLLDGADEETRKAALSAADVFAFPIDNIQETFGLAPLEAMAAGLPVLATDWDGLRDTVTDETGILVPTYAVRPEGLISTTLRYMGGTDGYQQYLSQVSAVTGFDMGAMVAGIVALAQNPGLRARLGAAGKARIAAEFDWGRVVPQMQDLWAEQTAMRLAAAAGGVPAAMASWKLPIAPSPTHLFAAYPSAIFEPGTTAYRLRADAPALAPSAMMVLRDYIGTRRVFETPENVEKVLGALRAAGPSGAALTALQAQTAMPARRVERVMIWLLKYGYIEAVLPGALAE